MSTPTLPPKTCEIDRMITKPEDIERVIAGKKISTRRNGRYADPGEVMILNGKSFRVDRVYQETLGDLNDEKAKMEGYDNLEEYKQSILSIHPGMPWLPQMKVWVHEFSAVE
ncbi:ASCH domain-containing protein [Ammoniphilus sp. CFH 90114]|uniref:ASCH domain-containing protein n=1 Tax=Ammoniphilus sp. CFH 90114 TaxID=2493665 RepID=UPI00100F3905|nr:ASCH domain-containing protein [Ammoniphilus sp. CFH 90114]RXT06363.1 ASCH domain-containing protein [Ammoniphilus sp. CFH 90114]